MSTLQMVLWMVLGIALVISVVTDLLSRRILDVVTYPAMAVALLGRLGAEGLGSAEDGLGSGMLGALLGLLPFAFFAWRGRVGWGDVKLMAVVGATSGYPQVLAALVFVSLAGALQAVVALVWHGEVWNTLAACIRRRLPRAAGTPVLSGSRHIPYALAIATGSLCVLWWEQHGSQ